MTKQMTIIVIGSLRVNEFKDSVIHRNLYITRFIIVWFWIYDSLKMDPKNAVDKQNYTDHIKKMTILGNFSK